MQGQSHHVRTLQEWRAALIFKKPDAACPFLFMQEKGILLILQLTPKVNDTIWRKNMWQ